MIILLDEAENDMKNYAVQGGIIGRWITTSEIICIILHILKAGCEVVVWLFLLHFTCKMQVDL